MATATMGLRRRVPVNNSPTPSASSTSNKRSRSENNNSPSHGNLNSLNVAQNEPPAKKSRGTSTNGSKSSATSVADSSSGQGSRSRATSGKSGSHTKVSTLAASTTTSSSSRTEMASNGNVLSASSSWCATSGVSDGSPYGSVTGLNLAGGQSGMCSGGLSMSTTIPYMAPSIATFVGNATNLGKSTSVSYLDISNMTGGAVNSTASGALNSTFIGANKTGPGLETKGNMALPFSGATPTTGGGTFGVKSGQGIEGGAGAPKKFQNNAMFNAYQPWVIKTYGDLAKTKTITIKKYARILRTLRGEEVNSAENSKFRFWVKSKGFYIGQPEGYDAKPADRIIGRHAVTSPGLDPPLYVPTQLPHNKSLNGAEGTVPPGRVYKKVAIVENFFDIIHAVHVDLEGRPGKHAGQKRTYRTITETYAFLPREAVTRFLLGCTECQRRPRTPSPTNLSNHLQTTAASPVTPLSPTPGTALSASPVQNSPKPREASHAPESKSLYNYRHHKQQKTCATTEKLDKEREEKYNPLSITNLLKKEPTTSFPSNTESLTESRRTPESDRASSRSSASSKRRRMLPEGRTPSPQPTLPLPRPWSPGIDPKSTAIDYSLPITTSYLKHQQRILAEKNKASLQKNVEVERTISNGPEVDAVESERFSPAAGLIDTNLNLLATIQHLHCQVMLALTERLRPSVVPTSLTLSPTSAILPKVLMSSELRLPTDLGENHS